MKLTLVTLYYRGVNYSYFVEAKVCDDGKVRVDISPMIADIGCHKNTTIGIGGVRIHE